MNAINRHDAALLWDMVRAIEEIQQFTTGISKDEYLESVWQKRLVERNLEILGEAARYVSPEFQAEHSEIDWRNTVGLRNVIIHRYRQVNHELLWSIVQEGLPQLLLTLQALLPEEPEPG